MKMDLFLHIYTWEVFNRKGQSRIINQIAFALHIHFFVFTLLCWPVLKQVYIMDERTKPLNLPNHSKSQYVTRVPDVASSGLVLGKTLIHIIRKLHGSSDI